MAGYVDASVQVSGTSTVTRRVSSVTRIAPGGVVGSGTAVMAVVVTGGSVTGTVGAAMVVLLTRSAPAGAAPAATVAVNINAAATPPIALMLLLEIIDGSNSLGSGPARTEVRRSV